MSTNNQINLCIPSTGLGAESDWRRLYEAAFPVDERMPVSEISSLLSTTGMLLHRTTDKDGALLCFSLVTPMSNFSLLAYIATDQTRRSGGVGTKHMQALLVSLREKFPQHLGLFLEIESTKEKGLSAEEEKNRQRRLQFYLKLGAKRLIDRDYLLPSYVPGTKARYGELLWFEYERKLEENQHKDIGPVICEIYRRGYGVSHLDEQFTRVMSQFPSVDGATCLDRDALKRAEAESEEGTGFWKWLKAFLKRIFAGKWRSSGKTPK